MVPSKTSSALQNRSAASLRRLWFRRGLTLLVLGALAATTVWCAFEIVLWRGASAIERRDHSTALWYLNGAGWIRPDNAERHYLLARAYRRLGQFDLVERHLKRAFELGWNPDDLNYEQQLALLQTRQYEGQQISWGDLFRSAGSDGPEICEAYVTLHLARLDVNAARTAINVWKTDYPDDPGSFFNEGRLAEVYLEWGQAVAAYQQALALDVKRDDIRERLVLSLLKLGQLQEALEQLDHFNSSPSVLRLQLTADVQYRLQDSDAAVETLHTLFDRQPHHLPATKLMAQIHSDREEYGAALGLLEPQVEQHSEDHELRNLYARALQRVGRQAEAVEHLKFVAEAADRLASLGPLMEDVTANPQNPELWFRVAMIHYRYQSREDGVTWLKQLLEIAPGYEPAHRALAEYYEGVGDSSLASRHRRFLQLPLQQDSEK